MADARVPTILVVDDDERNRQLAVLGMGGHGWHVLEASGGLEALILTEQHHPDVIVLDIQMPGVDGLEVLRRLRAHHDARVSQAWVLAATALAMPGDRQRCLDAGASDYLSRPFSFKELRARVSAALEQSQPSSVK